MCLLIIFFFFKTTGKGGRAVIEEASEKIANMKVIKNRKITVNFNADINSAMSWNFRPQQPYIKVSNFDNIICAIYELVLCSSPVNPLEGAGAKYEGCILCFYKK